MEKQINSTILPNRLPPRENLEEAFSGLILSASGWRKVFAPSGNEEDPAPNIRPEDAVITAAAAAVFAELLKGIHPRPVCALGTDTRPTGAAIASVFHTVLSALGVQVRYLAAVAAPEIMAYAGRDEEVSSFAYVTASHNPVGHNGFKFGLAEGGVLEGKIAAGLIENLKSLWADSGKLESLLPPATEKVPALPGTGDTDTAGWRKDARRAYLSLTREVVSGSGDAAVQESFFSGLRRGGSLACVADFNGGARSLSIDGDILAEAGVELHAVNGTPGVIVHRIVPEGSSLDPCREALEKLFRTDRRFRFGYVPDNDGDRGNLVYINTSTGKAEAMEAQDVFALSVLAELLYRQRLSEVRRDNAKASAVVVNGPTSGRIEKIAGLLGARVFRCEVGEANVVSLAREKRLEGYSVPILGEGSNGGNITHPSAVRDPIDTVFSLLKLLLPAGGTDLFGLWCGIIGKERPSPEQPGVQDILASLPAFTTTGAYEEEAKIRIRTNDHVALKRAWEELFLRDWELRKSHLTERANITGWKERNYEGTKAVEGFGPAFRSGKQRGGLSIMLLNPAGETRAFLWMRGSGTEPVFRVMVDVEGDNRELHDYLLKWHRTMVLEADTRVNGGSHPIR